MTRKNVHFSGHLLSSETIRSDTIKKSVNSVRCYQIAFRGLGNHAERLADTFRPLGNRAERLANTFSSSRKRFLTKSIPPIGECSCWANKKRSCPRGQLLP